MRIRPSRWTQWVVWPIAGLLTGTFAPAVILFSVVTASADPDLGIARFLFLSVYATVAFGVVFIPFASALGAVAGLVAAAMWSLLRLWQRDRPRQVVSGAVCTAVPLVITVVTLDALMSRGLAEFGGAETTPMPVWWAIVLVAASVVFGGLATRLVAWLEQPPRLHASGAGRPHADLADGGMLR